MPPHREASPFRNDAATHAMETEETSVESAAAVREKRAAFMQLLRAGVRAKLQSADDDDQLQAGTGAWRALAWRNAYALEPFFQETVCGRALRVKQLLQGELTGFGTGLTVWPAACLLLKHLEHRYAVRRDENSLHDKLVVELGSGTGAVGIAAAMLGAGRVVLTDVQKILFLMEANVRTAQEICGNRLLVDVEAYEWGAPPSARLLHDDGALPDVVLISDCILPRLYPIEPLVDALDCLCGPHTTVIISYEPRYYALFDPKTRFWELLRKKNFAVREIDPDLYHPHYRADDIEVWEARRLEK